MVSDGFFSQKIISTEIRYKTYDNELLVIVEVFKTLCYNIKGCKHEILVFKDYNILHYLINIKKPAFVASLTQKLSKYHP